MCECGCTIGNPSYKLPINDDSCYIIELYSGCDYCSAAPGIIIRKINDSSVFWEQDEESEVFPLTKIDDYEEGAIKCGLEPDEFKQVTIRELSGTEVDDIVIDDDLAEIIGEDLWKVSMRRMPTLVTYKK